MKKILSFIIVLTILVSSSAVFANAVCSTDYFPIEQPPGVVGAEVYGFKNPEGWDEVYVYARYGWAGDVENAPWPGVKLNPTYVAGYGTIYEYSFATGYYRDIIFNDGSPLEDNPYQVNKEHIFEIVNNPANAPFLEGNGVYIDPENSHYQELYYHYGERSETIPEYILVELRNDYKISTPCVTVLGDYLLRDYTISPPFKHGYAVYMPFDDMLLSIPQAIERGVENLEACLPFCNRAELIGDMDGDDRLSVKDATYIQKLIAELETDYWDSLENYKKEGEELPINFLSDYDRDGKRTIKDATAIQKYIAGLSVESEEKEIPFYIIDEFRVEYRGDDLAFDYCTSREEAAAVYESFGDYWGYTPELGREYNEAFFREHSLVFMTGLVGGSCCSQHINKLTVKNDLLTVYRELFQSVNPTPDMNVQVVVFAVANQHLEGVTRFTGVTS